MLKLVGVLVVFGGLSAMASPMAKQQAGTLTMKSAINAAKPVKFVSPTANLMIQTTSQNAQMPTVMSFQEWKSSKIAMSSDRLRRLHKQYVEIRAVNPQSPALPMLQQDLAQERWNLEVAQDLSTRDYLYLYVKSQGPRERLPEVAARLTSEEVSLFLESYFQLIDRTQPSLKKRTRLGVQGF